MTAVLAIKFGFANTVTIFPVAGKRAYFVALAYWKTIFVSKGMTVQQDIGLTEKNKLIDKLTFIIAFITGSPEEPLLALAFAIIFLTDFSCFHIALTDYEKILVLQSINYIL